MKIIRVSDTVNLVDGKNSAKGQITVIHPENIVDIKIGENIQTNIRHISMAAAAGETKSWYFDKTDERLIFPQKSTDIIEVV